MRLAGCNAVVTGAASGIGLATMERLRGDGARVFGIDRAGAADLLIDVASADAAETMVTAAVAALGSIDILVCNAGISGFMALDGHSDDVWDDTIAINLTSVFKLCRAAAPQLKASNRARIITVGSVMSRYGDAGMAAYSVSKHGVLGLTRSLATELGPDGVTVNCVMPGAILTGITAPAFAAMPDFEAFWRDKAPLKRIGTPDDVAAVIAFLASDDARFVSGHGIAVDGGAMAHP